MRTLYPYSDPIGIYDYYYSYCMQEAPGIGELSYLSRRTLLITDAGEGESRPLTLSSPFSFPYISGSKMFCLRIPIIEDPRDLFIHGIYICGLPY